MIKINLYHCLPSDTWAFAYRIPEHPNVVGLVAGIGSRERAQQSALYLSQRLELQLEYVA